ncbi:MAG: GIY-YIG nuclease family protein [bacterium]
MTARPEHVPLTDAIRRQVPTEPGVYLFYGGRGELLYVGKSINLRQRMLSYFRLDLSTAEPRVAQTALGIARFSFRTTRTELDALLLEDELIKTLQPTFNVRQKEYTEYQYLVLSTDRYPTCRPVDAKAPPESGALFGPFKDRYVVADILDLIGRYLQLRTCGEAEPNRRCLNHELQRCAGPCRGEVSRRKYATIVQRTRAFLEGDDSVIAERVAAAMQETSARHDFEQAAVLRDTARFVQRFCSRQSFWRYFLAKDLVLAEAGPPAVSYVFRQGILTWRGEPPDDSDPVDLAPARPGATASADRRFLLDRANIVHGWIRRHSETCEYRFV